MEQQNNTGESVSNAAVQETRPVAWVAPLQSMAVLSITEFTRNSGFPGADIIPSTVSAS